MAELPPLPADLGPWRDTWANTIAICVIMRDENTTDVREWLQYHKWLGVDRVLLSESVGRWRIRPGIEDFIESGFVEYRREELEHQQTAVYRRCLHEHREDYDWMAFIDADEFISLRGKSTSLKEVLADYRYFPGVALNWIMVGSNGRETRPPAGGVLRHYTSCNPVPNSHIKVIANTWFAHGPAHHPHNLYFRGWGMPVTEAKVPVPYACATGHRRPAGTTHCHPEAAHAISEEGLRTVARLALFHYFSKSAEDYQIKITRGTADKSKPRTMDNFRTMAVNGQKQAPICKELSRIADECCLES